MKKNGRCSFAIQLMLMLLLGILCITLCACQPSSGTTPTPGTKPTPTPGGNDTPTTEQTLTITFDPMNGDPTFKQTVKRGDSIEIPEVPQRANYTFAGWQKDGEAYDLSAPVTSSFTLKAKWEFNHYTVTFDPNNGENAITKEINHGLVVSAPEDPTKEGCTFLGWYLDGAKYNFKTPVTQAITLVAKWDTNTYRVTFDPQNGDDIRFVDVEKNTAAEKPEDPTKEHYTFLGWYVGDTLYDFNAQVLSDLTITAKWKADTLTVTFDPANLGEVFTQDVEYLSTPTLPEEPTRRGYSFIGWFLGDTKYNFDTPITESVMLKARWNINVYTVTFDADNGTEATTERITHGSKVSAPSTTPTKEHYTFLGWYVGDTLYDFNAQVLSDLTITAKWKADTLTVTFDPANLGEVFAQDVEYLSIPTLPEEPTRRGYSFIGWYLGDNKYNFDTPITESVTLKARWNINVYTVTFDADNGTDAIIQSATHGSKVSAPSITPTKEHYTFVGWFVDDAPYDFNAQVLSDLTITAKWEKVTYTVTFDAKNDAPVTTQTVAHGEKATKPTEPTRNGYAFLGWYLEDQPYDFSAPVTGTITLVAKWSTNAYAVTFHPNNGSDSFIVNVEYLQKLNAPQPPEMEDYTFLGWYLGETLYDFDTPVTEALVLTAKWEKITYTVTLDAQNGTASTTASVVHGEKATKPSDPTKAGHSFLGWYLGETLYDFDTPVTEVLVLTAKWEKLAYTVTFDPANLGELFTQDVEYLSIPTLPEEPTRRGYSFIGWYLGDNKYNFDTPITESITLKARWNINVYSVTFDADNGTDAIIQSATHGSKVSAPSVTPTKEHYTFVGWFVDDVPYNFNAQVLSDLTITAKWEKVTYTVTFDPANLGELFTQDVEYLSIPTLPEVPTRKGYSFIGWYLGDNKYNFDTPITESITLKARWNINVYTVTFDAQNGTENTTETVNHGSKVSAPSITPTKEHYTFVGWFVGNAPYNFNAQVLSDLTITAKWKKISYTVTFDANNGTESTTQTVAHGDKVTKPSDPTKEYHVFLGWYDGETEYDFDTAVTASITLTAKWEKVTYTVTFDAQNGTASTTGTVAHGDIATEPADPTKEHYTFLGWYDGETKYNFDTAVTADVTLTAKWEIITVTITFDTAGGEEIAPMVVTEGSVLTSLPVPQKLGYTSTGWYLNGTAVSDSLVIDGDITLTTGWELVTYTIKYEKNGGTVYGSLNTTTYTIESADIVLPTNVSKTNYVFVGWIWEGQSEPTKNAVIKTGTTGNLKVEAVFAPKNVQITFVTGDTQKTVTVTGNSVPSYDGEVPDYNGMKFVMWYPAIKVATANTTYTAIYTDQMDVDTFKRAFETQNFVWQNHGYRDMQVATALYSLVLQEHENPLSGPVRDRIIEQIGHLTASGSAPEFDCSTNWPYGIVCATLAMAKDTPSVWDNISDSLKERVDTMMEAFAYIVSLGTSDQNAYSTGPAFGGNYKNNWNVNYALGNIPCMVFVVYYFGNGDIDEGARIVNDKLKGFDEEEYDRMIRAFETYGWTNALTCWTTPAPKAGAADAKQMLVYGGAVYGDNYRNPGTLTGCGTGKGVNNGGVDFTYTCNISNNPLTIGKYNNITLYEPERIVMAMIDYNFAYTVTSEHYYTDTTTGTTSRVAWILDGTKSRYEGMMGMMYEFGLPNRSAITYTGHDFDMITVLMSAAKTLKRYDVNGDERTPVTDESGKHLSIYDYTEDEERWSRIQVGMEDFIYKYVHGYQDFVHYAQGGIIDEQKYESGAGIGYWVCKGIWRTTMKPLGDLPTAEEEIKYTVSFDTAGGDAIDPIEVEQGTVLNDLPVPQKLGYTSTGWYLNGEAVTFPLILSEDATLTTSWELVTYTIEYEKNGGTVYGSLSTTTYTIESADISLPTNVIKTNYTFVGWIWEGQAEPATVIPTGTTGNLNVEAVFVSKNVQITFIAGDTQKTVTVARGGTPSYDGEVADYNGMQFVMWYPTIKVATENTTYTAIYTNVSTVELFGSSMTGSGYCGAQYKTHNHPFRDMQAMCEIYTLVLQQHEYPQIGVADVVLTHIRSMISDTFSLAIDCSTNWQYGITAATFAMIKDTPTIWNQLSASEIERIDTMMLAFAYIHSLGTSSYNDYRTGPGLMGNYRKTWNPNYRLGNVMGMAFIPYYFGNGDIDDGADWLNAKIRTFDEAEYENMLGKFSIYGWDEAYACWTTEGITAGNGDVSTSTAKQLLVYGGDVISLNTNGQGLQGSTGVGVNNGGRDYTYTGYFGTAYTLYQPDMILRDLAYFNYSGGAIKSDHWYDTTGDGVAEQVGSIYDGTSSPYEGKMGMMLELASGNRSSVSYCTDDFDMCVLMFSAASHLPRYNVDGDTRTVKTVNGGQTVYLFDYTSDAELWSMIQYGNEDYIYKYVHGYNNYATGSYGTSVSTSFEKEASRGYWLMKALWRNTMLPLGTVTPAD